MVAFTARVVSRFYMNKGKATSGGRLIFPGYRCFPSFGKADFSLLDRSLDLRAPGPPRTYGLGGGVGRRLGVGRPLGVGVGLAVDVGVGETVAVGVGVDVAVGVAVTVGVGEG